MFQKIFLYDHQLEGKTALRIEVAYERETGELLETENALRRKGFSVVKIRSSQISDAAAGADVIYIMPGALTEALKALCNKNKILSISPVSEVVEQGRATVSVTLSPDGRPSITINVVKAKSEGHSFSSSLLALAKVVSQASPNDFSDLTFEGSSGKK